MFTAGYASSMGRPSVKARAQVQLTRIRDASKNLFRNLHHPMFTGKDESGGVERAETLARYRDQLLQVLCELQTELNDNVTELRRCKSHKEKMESLQKQIADREKALKDFGLGLKEAESVLSEGLRNSLSDEPDRARCAEVEVEEVLRFAHTISYSTHAPDSFNPDVPMLGALPPAPHTAVLARSRLMAANRPSRVVPEEGAGRAGPAKVEKQRDQVVRMWEHPVLEPGSEDQAMAVGERGGGSGAGRKRRASEAAEGERAAKQAVSISPLAMCAKEPAIRDRKREEGGDGVDGLQSMLGMGALVIPERPAKWRPGDPVVIAPDRG